LNTVDDYVKTKFLSYLRKKQTFLYWQKGFYVPHADVEDGEAEAHGLRLGGHVDAVELLKQIQPEV
jgi:hypothetical protein